MRKQVHGEARWKEARRPLCQWQQFGPESRGSRLDACCATRHVLPESEDWLWTGPPDGARVAAGATGPTQQTERSYPVYRGARAAIVNGATPAAYIAFSFKILALFAVEVLVGRCKNV